MWVRIFALLLWLSAGQAASQAIRVIDGDTFQLADTRIRILDIDAPELGQICKTSTGKSYKCGESSAKALGELLDLGRVRCAGRKTDSYGRLLATCTVGGQDIGALMVAAGEAVAFVKYGRTYLPQQVDAQKAGRGLWRGTFEMPWDFRKAQWQEAAAQVPDSACPIKGNINARGDRIFYTPASRHYRKTVVNQARGERWFCDEADAIAAGWRAPYR